MLGAILSVLFVSSLLVLLHFYGRRTWVLTTQKDLAAYAAKALKLAVHVHAEDGYFSLRFRRRLTAHEVSRLRRRVQPGQKFCAREF